MPMDSTHFSTSQWKVLDESFTFVIFSAHMMSITPHSLILNVFQSGKEPHLAMQIYNEQWRRFDLCHLVKILWTLLELKIRFGFCFRKSSCSFFLFFIGRRPWNLTGIDFLAQGFDSKKLCCQILLQKPSFLFPVCPVKISHTYLELWSFLSIIEHHVF